MQRPVSKLIAALGLLLLLGSAQGEDLLDIYQQARESDPQLQAAAAAHRAAMEVRPQARSRLLPNIGLTANIAQNRENLIDSSLGLPEGETNYPSNGYTLSLTQALYHHDYYVQLRQADARIAQANAQYDSERQALFLRVSEAYFEVLAALDNLEFAQAEKLALSEQLRQTQQRFEVGLTAITDVREAQAGYDQAVAAEIVAQNALDAAWEALREITGKDYARLAPLMEEIPLIAPEPADIDKWVETAGQQNLALLAAESGAQIAREEVNRRRAGHYPVFDIVASHSYSDNSDASFGSEREDTSIGVQMTLPIYQGGLISSQTREAAHLYTQALEQLEQQRRAAVRETRNSYLRVTAGISNVQARKQALASAQTALEATQAGFEVGTRTAVDVTNAQRVRFGARRDYARARYDYLLSTLRLKQAAGILTEGDLGQVNALLQ